MSKKKNKMNWERNLPLSEDTSFINSIHSFVPEDFEYFVPEWLEKYIDHLAYDDQIAIYMLATKSERAIYTIMQKPMIRQGKTESEAEYLERVSAWYSPEHVLSVNVYRTAGELSEKKAELIYLVKQIQRTKLFWRNPNTCALTPCPYASICLNYEPAMELAGYTKKERKNEELWKY